MPPKSLVSKPRHNRAFRVSPPTPILGAPNAAESLTEVYIAAPTPVTDAGITIWTVVMMDGSVVNLELPGENGRVSFGGGGTGFQGHDVRFYRGSGAVYDAVLPDVKMVWSNRVKVTYGGPDPLTVAATKAAETFEMAKEKVRAEAIVDRVVGNDF